MKKEFDGTKEKQQQLGAFYTPDELVKKMYEKLLLNGSSNICGPLLDPTCGYGNILIYGLQEKFKYYKKNNIQNAAEKAFSEIYGIELDKEVLDTCKENLRESAAEMNLDKNIVEKYLTLHFHLGDALNPMNYIFSDTDEEQKELDDFKKSGLPSGISYRLNKYYQSLHNKKFSDSDIIKFVNEWQKF
jgi:hypothetical protein